MNAVIQLLHEIRWPRLLGVVGLAAVGFGTYGWSGLGIALIISGLSLAFEVARG